MAVIKKKISKEIISISLKLRELRIEKGYSSYEKFAIENEIDRKQYWRAENNANLTIESLLKILRIHKITLKEFFNMIDK